MRGFYRVLMIALLLSHATAAKASGAKIVVNEDMYINFDVLLQPQFNLSVEPPTAPQRAFLFQPEIRRWRWMAFGQITPCINFFLAIDSPHFGMSGDWTPRAVAYDAYVELGLDRALQFNTGLILVPFSHNQMQAATTLLSMDYASFANIPPAPFISKTGVPYLSTSNSRDVGVMARGTFGPNDVLEYRLAVTQGISKNVGVSGLNMHALPRLTARLTANIFEAEGGPGASGYFYDGLYLQDDGQQLISDKKVLAIGTSASWQQNALRRGTETIDYKALNADVFLDLPLGDRTQSINGQVNWYYYAAGNTAHTRPAHGLFAELGYRYHRIEPLVGGELLAVTGTTLDSAAYWRGGVNIYLAGHNASIKVDAGAKSTSGAPYSFAGRVQTQLYF